VLDDLESSVSQKFTGAHYILHFIYQQQPAQILRVQKPEVGQEQEFTAGVHKSWV
jgi:hypothetical protein